MLPDCNTSYGIRCDYLHNIKIYIATTRPVTPRLLCKFYENHFTLTAVVSTEHIVVVAQVFAVLFQLDLNDVFFSSAPNNRTLCSSQRWWIKNVFKSGQLNEKNVCADHE